MARLLPLVLVLPLGLALVGCGASRSPEDVVRAWSDAVNANDNATAAALFAADAQVVQDRELVLHNRDDAVRWNASLPCAGQIDSLRVSGHDVTVTFTLADRPGHRCDGPGQEAAAVFRVEHGKITLWHQTPPPPSDGQTI